MYNRKFSENTRQTLLDLRKNLLCYYFVDTPKMQRKMASEKHLTKQFIEAVENS